MDYHDMVLVLYSIAVTIVAVWFIREALANRESADVHRDAVRDEIAFLREENSRLYERLADPELNRLTMINNRDRERPIQKLEPNDPLAIKDDKGVTIGHRGANVI